MNIYAKMQKVKYELSKRELKKSGVNKFSNFTYYELGDFLPSIIELCTKHGLFTHINFTDTRAELTIVNVDDLTEQIGGNEGISHEEICYFCPMKELELKGANKIQALGGAQTYLRRYLYMNAFDIVEADMFDNEEFEKKQKEKREKAPLEELLDKLKAKYTKADDASKKEIGAMFKSLGYTTFSDLSKKSSKEDIISLAQKLDIEIPKVLTESEKEEK